MKKNIQRKRTRKQSRDLRRNAKGVSIEARMLLMLMQKYHDEFFSLQNVDPFASTDEKTDPPEEITLNRMELIATVRDISLAQAIAISWIRKQQHLNEFEAFNKEHRLAIRNFIEVVKHEQRRKNSVMGKAKAGLKKAINKLSSNKKKGSGDE